MDQRRATPSDEGSAETSAASSVGAPPTVPRSVELAIRATWGLVLAMALVVVLLAVFRDAVVGAWASGHEGAREVFDQGGREALERSGYAPPSFLPVAVTMLVVAAMLVWVLAAMLRRGHRWGQLGLFALLVGSAYVSIALGFVLAPPPVFVVVAAVSLLIEGVAVICLWHPDTRAFLAGPWVDSSEVSPEEAESASGAAGGGPDRSA